MNISYTAKQLMVMQIIATFVREKSIAPTYSEIATKMGVSSITVFEHCDALKRKGAISMEKGVQRSIKVLDQQFIGMSDRERMLEGAVTALCALLKTTRDQIEQRLRAGTEFTACATCGHLTDMTGTKRCDGCWEKQRHAEQAPAYEGESWDDIPAGATAPALAR